MHSFAKNRLVSVDQCTHARVTSQDPAPEVALWSFRVDPVTHFRPPTTPDLPAISHHRWFYPFLNFIQTESKGMYCFGSDVFDSVFEIYPCWCVYRGLFLLLQIYPLHDITQVNFVFFTPLYLFPKFSTMSLY